MLAVERLADDEVRTRATLTVPTSPRLTWLVEPQLKPKLSEDAFVEREGALEVTNAREDVREHAACVRVA